MEPTAQHHLLLEEIGRLEKERDALTQKINALRGLLPKPEKVRVDRQTGLAPQQAAPVQTIMAAPVKPPEPAITDHAVLRWLERHHGFNFEDVRRNLLAKTEQAVRMGASSVKLDGGKFVIAGNRVVTFAPKGKPMKVRTGKRPPRYHESDDA